MDKYFPRINKAPSVGSSTPRPQNVVANVDTPNPNTNVDTSIPIVEIVDRDDMEQFEPLDGDDIELIDGDDIVDGSDDVIRDDADSRIRKKTKVDDKMIESDPALRMAINDYEPSIRDVIRREYTAKGPCQPASHKSPQDSLNRAFLLKWFKEWTWLEYSVSVDAAFCFWCFLFKGATKNVKLNDAFVVKGCRNWKKGPEKFRDHVGPVGGVHNESRTMYFDFINQKQSLTRCVSVATHSQKVQYRNRLTFSLELTRQLLLQGQAFRGHDESKDSLNRGNFLVWHGWSCRMFPEIGKAIEKAPSNLQLTSHRTQDDLIASCGALTRRAIVHDIGGKFFSLLIDEARDASIKEQMAIVVRYVNNKGEVVDRFLGVVHVTNTKAESLKRAIDAFFAKHSLSISRLRGQGYDGASNMRSELSGLKTRILEENPYARFIHCFAHQLQLVIVATCKDNRLVSDFFTYVTMIVNMAGSSCKRKDAMRQKTHDDLVQSIERGEISTGRGLNQETSLARPGATRWGSHYMTINRLLHLWSSVLHVLYNVYDDGIDTGSARGLIEKMRTYQFVFIAHFMKLLLGITNALSQFLQKKGQNILEAVNLVQSCKKQIQQVRDNGWDDLIKDVNDFCQKNQIRIVRMEDDVEGEFYYKRVKVTNRQHFRVDIFCQVIDKHTQEMKNRFSEANTELLTLLGCLDPKNLFSNFNISKALQLAKLYPEDFTEMEQIELRDQLGAWIVHMRETDNFSELEDLGEVTKLMVQVGIHCVFPLVYRLLELVLVLPVATASIERAFSTMTIVKTDLRNKMGDEHLSDNLVCYIERDIFTSIDNEPILEYYQAMRTRKLDLLPLSS